MSKEALKERVQFTFDKNPKYGVLFSTSDNNVFTDADLAEQHSIRLKDTTVEMHTRKDAEEPTVEPTVEPVVEPTVEPVAEPTVEPVVEPTVEAEDVKDAPVVDAEEVKAPDAKKTKK